ncbi:MAG: hypothetical protein HYY37_01325 [Candidatus Aenigmarchaeota archaeon]|nr:hypothetical protein [Candidatus Aenigmarchaeota archaeon]
MHIVCKEVETISECIDAIRIRVDVFIKEQGFQVGWEPDEDDKESQHYVALVDNEVVATARIRIIDDTTKIERMAIKEKRKTTDARVSAQVSLASSLRNWKRRNRNEFG